jgi:uncharacterized cupredoxin-like copper-binding protein
MARSVSARRPAGGRYLSPGIAAAFAAAATLIGGCGSSGQVRGKLVSAIETEYQIVLSQARFTPGTYTFDVENHGQLTHSLEVIGPGTGRRVLSKNIAPGQSADLTVRLRAGTYELICPIDHHARRGMSVTIRVSG